MKVNVLFYLKKSKGNKRGLAPIWCRITVNKNRAEFSTGQTLPLDRFDQDRQRAKGESGLIDAINSNLSWIQTQAQILKLYAQHKGIAYSAQYIKEKLVNPRVAPTLNEAVKDFCQNRIDTSECEGTKKTYRNRLNNFIQYFKNTNRLHYTLDMLNPQLCDEFICWLQIEKKSINPDYMRKHIEVLKAVERNAMALGFVEYLKLANVRTLRTNRGAPLYLTEVEITQLTAHKFIQPRLQHVAHLFLMQCYTGMAYVDLMEFNVSKIVKIDNKDFIEYKRGKTGVTALPLLLHETMAIINLYPTGLPQISNQKYNSYLKEVADILGIETKLTTHIGRKTFGMRMLNEYGLTIEAVSKMLGHSTIRMTEQSYSRVTHRRLVNEVISISQPMAA